MRKFWMVWREKGRMPRNKHYSFSAARAEAERLCQKENDQIFILEATESCRPIPRVDWQTVEDELPF